MKLSRDNGRTSLRTPRIRPGLAVVPCEDGVMVAAGTWGRRITGADAQRILLPVARLLDGRHTVDEIAAGTGFEHVVVEQLLETMVAYGCVEDADNDLAAGSPALLTAYLNKTGHPAGAQKAKALSSACVLLAGPGDLTDRMAADLVGSGVGTVITSGPDLEFERARLEAGLPGHALALVHDDGGDKAARLISGLTTGEYGQPLPVLRVFISAAGTEVGPLYDACSPPNATTCHQCVRAGRDRLWPSPKPAQTSAGATDVGCALAVTEALAILADLGPRRLRSHQTVIFVSWPELSLATYAALPEPECAVCRGRPAGTDLLETYEDIVQMEPEFFQRPVMVSDIRTQQRAEVQSYRVAHVSGPRVQLSHKQEAPCDDLATIAALLRGAAGRRHPGSDEDYTRWTASGGNLGSVQLYLISRLPLLEWQPGTIFRYNDLLHELTVVNRSAVLADAMFGSDIPSSRPPLPDLAIVLVADLARLSAEFQSFALRLGHLDAGCALAQLNAITSLHGLQLAVSTRWNPSLPVDLELLEDSHAITSVAWISGLGDKHAHSR